MTRKIATLLMATCLSACPSKGTPVGTTLATMDALPSSSMFIGGTIGEPKGTWKANSVAYEFTGPAIGVDVTSFQISFETAEASFTPLKDSGPPAAHDSILTIRSLKLSVAANEGWKMSASCLTPNAMETYKLKVVVPCSVTISRGSGKEITSLVEIGGDGSIKAGRGIEWDVIPARTPRTR